MLAVLACNVPTDEYIGQHRLVTNRPDENDLIGTWVIDGPTIEDMRTEGGYDVSRPTSLTLRHDHSFEMTNMPDWYRNGFGESGHTLLNLSGQWSLDNADGGYWSVGLKAAEFAPRMQIREPRYASQPRYVLHIVISDPDSGHFMRFIKR